MVFADRDASRHYSDIDNYRNAQDSTVANSFGDENVYDIVGDDYCINGAGKRHRLSRQKSSASCKFYDSIEELASDSSTMSGSYSTRNGGSIYHTVDEVRSSCPDCLALHRFPSREDVSPIYACLEHEGDDINDSAQIAQTKDECSFAHGCKPSEPEDEFDPTTLRISYSKVETGTVYRLSQEARNGKDRSSSSVASSHSDDKAIYEEVAKKMQSCEDDLQQSTSEFTEDASNRLNEDESDNIYLTVTQL